MRTTLTLLGTFTTLASAWLVTMYLVLQHSGFAGRAAMAAAFMGISVVIVISARAARPAVVLRAAAAAGALLLGAAGCWAIRTNVDDGFVDILGLAFIVQAVLALIVLRRAPAPASTPARS